MDLYERQLLDAPDVAEEPFCAVCGRPASDRHHVIVRGIGGHPAEVERRIPVIRLCGRGNTSGCHGLAHERRLQLWWDGQRWLYRVGEPMTLQEAVEGHLGEFSELPGWRRQRRTVTFGRGEPP